MVGGGSEWATNQDLRTASDVNLVAEPGSRDVSDLNWAAEPGVREHAEAGGAGWRGGGSQPVSGQPLVRLIGRRLRRPESARYTDQDSYYFPLV